MSAAGFVVRVGTAADLAGIVEMERGIAAAPHWAAAEYAAIVDGDAGGMVRRCLLVAEAEGRLVGFAVGKVVASGAETIAELESVAVEETARRCGVGRALCGAVIEWSRSQGAEALELEVRVGSSGAVALYAGLGFVTMGRRRGYYDAPVEDALVMRLSLVQLE